tara:strand:- start:2 stop:856 length:855 start_codon:yes stop_codon:yes gene_type:complete
MSDLDKSDNENNSDTEISIDYDDSQIKPTFSKKSTPLQSSELNIKYGLDENLIIDDDDDDDDEDVNNLEDDNNDSDNDSENDSENDSDNEDNEEEEEEDKYNSDIEQETILNKKKTSNHSGKKVNKNIEELPLAKIDIPTNIDKNDSDFDSDNDEEEEDDYLQKFDKEMRENYILKQHPESNIHNYDEVYNLAVVQRNKENIIIDDLHKTIPILTKYEKTKILGLRAKQINNGAKPFVKFSKNIIDGYLIALKELEEKIIPVIIRRPLPNGASEYWHLHDLEII